MRQEIGPLLEEMKNAIKGVEDIPCGVEHLAGDGVEHRAAPVRRTGPEVAHQRRVVGNDAGMDVTTRDDVADGVRPGREVAFREEGQGPGRGGRARSGVADGCRVGRPCVDQRLLPCHFNTMLLCMS